MNQDTCQVNLIDEQRIIFAREKMPDEETLADIAETFKLLGDLTRVRIIQALAASELCVCELAALLEMTSSAISHQLRLLRAAKIVRFRKDGKIVYYSLDDDHVRSLIADTLTHVRER